MKIIRTLWGHPKYTFKEVENKYKFENEVVYVWGKENEEYLRKLGYDTILMSDEIIDSRYCTQLTKYMHKLLVIEKADEQFDEYILIDWDTQLEQYFDEDFYKLLRAKGNVQCPLYALPNNFLDKILKKNLSDEMKDYFIHQSNFIKEYSWKFENLHVIPNFSFFYSNKAKIGKELIKIAVDNKLQTNIEEFAFYIWANTNLDDYIKKYEPNVVIGQNSDQIKEVADGLKTINNYIKHICYKKVYIGHKTKIKIIRALWGNSLYILNEIPKKPLFEDEFVYVWGKANYDFVKKLGYEAALVSETKTQGNTYDSHLKHFAHKLQALQFADEAFGEYLFLDWDVTLAKNIDDNFFRTIKNGNNLQCPLYAYHSNYRNDAIEYHKQKNDLTKNLDNFLIVHINELEKYHWKYEDIKVLPCFCFVYSYHTNIGTKLLNIMNANNILACIEEFALQVYSNCSLDEYISKHEPTVIRGKEKDKNLEGMTAAIKKINSYIDSKIDKNIYLVHDLK